ncbi:MAG: SpoIIE family protein phosphatase [Anaerolineales bacterium]|nr:SpoIIE family protein phosphatase [Anaerolineales bacterium]
MAQPTSPQTRNRLELLYRLSQTFNSSLDLTEVLNLVMDEVINVMHAERGFVMLLDEHGNLSFAVARGIDQVSIAEPQFQVSRSVIEQVAREGQPMLVSDAMLDPRISARQSVNILGLRAILCVPLVFKGQTLGVIFVDSRVQAGIFTPLDLDLLTAIASSAAVALENARLYQLAVEKGRLERELQMARQVQASMMPQDTPHIPGWDFAAFWQPARQVAGDYYDFITFRDGQLGLVIADVSDKGMPAALFMATARSIIRTSLDRSSSVVEGITQANRLLCSESSDGTFITLFCARLNSDTGDFTYINAGHNPPIFYQSRSSANMGNFVTLGRTGMALGVDADHTYKEQNLRVKPGDFILFYTDGVTDTFDAQEEPYGNERMMDVLQQVRSANATEILSAIQNSIQSFSNMSMPFDDITMMLIKRQ